MPTDENGRPSQKRKTLPQHAYLAHVHAGLRRRASAHDPFPAGRLANTTANPREKLGRCSYGFTTFFGCPGDRGCCGSTAPIRPIDGKNCGAMKRSTIQETIILTTNPPKVLVILASRKDAP